LSVIIIITVCVVACKPAVLPVLQQKYPVNPVVLLADTPPLPAVLHAVFTNVYNHITSVLECSSRSI